LISSARPLRGHFSRASKSMGLAPELLIEALSGRWSYDIGRRGERTVWYHVANAFSLLVATMAPIADQRTNQGDFKLRSVTCGSQRTLT